MTGRLITRSVLAVLATLAGARCASTTPARPGNETYSFWPPAPDEPRVQFLRSYRFSSDVEPPQGALDRIIFGGEQEVLPIAKPYGVAMWQGRIYVCDITNPGVVILDLLERQTRLMGTRGTDRMLQPTDIAIASDGLKYVADRRRGRVFVFDAQDRHIASFGHQGLIPVGVAVYGEELYVPDFQTQTVLVLDRSTGETLRSIGEAGGGPGQFIRPLGVEVAAGADVYVTDAIRGRVQKFAPDGTLMMAVGEIADSPGNFVRPKHVVVDDEGILYVVDAAFQNVQMFNADGELLMFFGGPGPHPGSMSLPAGIAISDGPLELFADDVHPAFEPQRLVLVTNQFGLNKVSVFALGRLREGKTVADILPQAADVLLRDSQSPDVAGPPLEPVPETGAEPDEP